MAGHNPCDTIREVILVVTCCDRYQTERTAFIVDYISSHGGFMQTGSPAVFACVQYSQLICSFLKHPHPPPQNAQRIIRCKKLDIYGKINPVSEKLHFTKKVKMKNLLLLQ